MLTLPLRSLAAVPALVFVAAACGGDATAVARDDEMVARRDARDFRGDARATLLRSSAGDTLFVYGTSPRGQPGNSSEVITVRVAYTGPGTYRLAEGDAAVWDLLGGDVTTAAFTQKVSGTLVVADGATVCGPIAGTFAFVAAAGEQVTRVADGRFAAHVAAIPGCPPGD